MRSLFLLVFLVMVGLVPSSAQPARETVLMSVDNNQSRYAQVARQLWEWAEVGYQEARSAELLMSELESAGFSTSGHVAGIPTAFVAEYGTGEPVIGILAEYDALPGLSQDAVPERQVRTEGGAGHACGHHLFGTASTAAAIALKDYLEESGVPGTIRLYGTPAEEGGAGKVYMVREGLFDDVDVVLHWHPGDRNDASPATTLANRSAKFRFHGQSTHAAGAPERGRSALDGVEAMNHMVNLLREHVPSETRIHYVITRGGLAPNVVPDFSEVYYYVRHSEASVMEGIFDRVVNAAEGAALGTGTEMDYEIIHGLHSVLPNEVLARTALANLQELGGIHYTADETAFALAIQESFSGTVPALGSQETVASFELRTTNGSTDVGDVSMVVPTVGVYIATWVPGTSAHSWQAVAAGGMSIGTKGMVLAAKVLSRTGVDLLTKPDLLVTAREEFERRRGPDFVYRSLLGDRSPPLDYRK